MLKCLISKKLFNKYIFNVHICTDFYIQAFCLSEIKYPMVFVVMEMGDTDLSRLLKTMSQEKQISLTMILYYWTEMLTAVKHIHDNGKYLNK